MITIVEPDIKEGLGGLRDLHYMSWMAKVFFKVEEFRQIKRFEIFSHFEINRLNHSRSFLLKVRNQLHRLSGRKEDRLLLPSQREISDILHTRDVTSNAGPEKFMRHIYTHMNRIRYGHEEFQRKTLDTIDPKPLEPTSKYLPPEFRVMKGNIVLKDDVLIEKDPLLILKALNEANQRDLFLGSGIIWRARKKIAAEGKSFVSSPEAKELFLKIFLTPSNPKILRLALEIGLINLFIPEFKRI